MNENRKENDSFSPSLELYDAHFLVRGNLYEEVNVILVVNEIGIKFLFSNEINENNSFSVLIPFCKKESNGVCRKTLILALCNDVLVFQDLSVFQQGQEDARAIRKLKDSFFTFKCENLKLTEPLYKIILDLSFIAEKNSNKNEFKLQNKTPESFYSNHMYLSDSIPIYIIDFKSKKISPNQNPNFEYIHPFLIYAEQETHQTLYYIKNKNEEIFKSLKYQTEKTDLYEQCEWLDDKLISKPLKISTPKKNKSDLINQEIPKSPVSFNSGRDALFDLTVKNSSGSESEKTASFHEIKLSESRISNLSASSNESGLTKIELNLKKNIDHNSLNPNAFIDQPSSFRKFLLKSFTLMIIFIVIIVLIIGVFYVSMGYFLDKILNRNSSK